MKKHTILFLAANPSDTDRLALDREARFSLRELEQSGYELDEDDLKVLDDAIDATRQGKQISWESLRAGRSGDRSDREVVAEESTSRSAGTRMLGPTCSAGPATSSSTTSMQKQA